MNLPNKITMLRILLIPFFVFFMLTDQIPYSRYIAVSIFIIASLTDKLLVCSALVCFVALPENPMPAWGVIVIISRDFIISGFRLVASDAGVVIAAGWWGKIKTVVQMLMSVLLIVDFDGEIINLVEDIFIYAAILLTVISLVDYLWKNREVLNDGNM